MSGFLIIAGLWAKKIFYVFVDHWRKILPIVAALIIFIFVFRFAFCSKPANEKIKEKILIDKIESNVLTNKKSEIEKDVNKKSNNSNAALGNLDNSLQRDSNTFTGNSEDRFCERFPNDSSCAGWRELRGL